MRSIIRVGSILNRPVFVCLLILLLSYLAAAQENEPTSRMVPVAPLLTQNSTLLVEQGELLFFVGENRVRVQPRAWQADDTGLVGFLVEHDEVRYQFSFAAEELQIGDETHPVARAQITAHSTGGTEQTAVVWLAWRHQAVRNPAQNTLGFLLSPAGDEIEREAPPLPWNERWTWFFEQNFFMRDRLALYGVLPTEAWETETRVRLPQLPLASIEPSSLIGFSKVFQSVGSDASEALSVMVPRAPMEHETWLEWQASLTLPEETTDEG